MTLHSGCKILQALRERLPVDCRAIEVRIAEGEVVQVTYEVPATPLRSRLGKQADCIEVDDLGRTWCRLTGLARTDLLTAIAESLLGIVLGGGDRRGTEIRPTPGTGGCTKITGKVQGCDSGDRGREDGPGASVGDAAASTGSGDG